MSVCISPVRKWEGRKKAAWETSSNQHGHILLPLGVYRPATNTTEVILHSFNHDCHTAFQTLAEQFKNLIFHICSYKFCVCFFLIYLEVCLWMLTVRKQGTAACCTGLQNMMVRLFHSFLQQVMKRKRDVENNERFPWTWTTPCHKRPGSEMEIITCQLVCAAQATGCRKDAGCQGGCVWWESHFPVLPSPYSHTTVREGKGQLHFSPTYFSANSKKRFSYAQFVFLPLQVSELVWRW